jgi:hypothetical protein
LPNDADANGAYHIALKGLMLLRRINEASSPKDLRFELKNSEWLKFAQEASQKRVEVNTKSQLPMENRPRTSVIDGKLHSNVVS